VRKSSVRIVGKAAMIAVPLAPTASIARHDGHRTDVNPVCCFTPAAPEGMICIMATAVFRLRFADAYHAISFTGQPL
jgi:hypothetical protein